MYFVHVWERWGKGFTEKLHFLFVSKTNEQQGKFALMTQECFSLTLKRENLLF